MEAGKMAQDRGDFIRRLFAVTVSVGFASQLNRLLTGSISGRRLVWSSLFSQHGHELILLCVSLVAVVASWEGYLVSIHRNPLQGPISGPIRFYIDIIIVFMYLILMLFCQVDNLWFVVLALIFVLYLCWDIVGAIGHFSSSTDQKSAYHRNSFVITAVWLVFFCALAAHNYLDVDRGFGFTSLAALIAVVLYRFDKHLRATWLAKLMLLTPPVVLLVIGIRS